MVADTCHYPLVRARDCRSRRPDGHCGLWLITTDQPWFSYNKRATLIQEVDSRGKSVHVSVHVHVCACVRVHVLEMEGMWEFCTFCSIFLKPL